MTQKINITIYKYFANFNNQNHLDSGPSHQQFYAMLQSGNYTFRDTIVKSGVVIYIPDSLDTTPVWETINGDNSNSTFVITSVGAAIGDINSAPPYPALQTKIEGSFNCKLYDKNGNSKTLTGSFNSPIAY